MNQEEIGKFIAKTRREKDFTQAGLAEKLGISDRAISKWENGKNMPDVSIMLELCSLLEIDVNELLSGKRLNMENYKEMAEKNLVELTKQEELNNKKLLSLELVIGYSSSISFLVLLNAACFAVENNYWRIGMILVGSVIFAIGMYYSIKLEHDAGYYECPNCKERYVPNMKDVVLAVHVGRSRNLKCPYCGKVGMHKKVLVK